MSLSKLRIIIAAIGLFGFLLIRYSFLKDSLPPQAISFLGTGFLTLFLVTISLPIVFFLKNKFFKQ